MAIFPIMWDFPEYPDEIIAADESASSSVSSPMSTSVFSPTLFSIWESDSFLLKNPKMLSKLFSDISPLKRRFVSPSKRYLISIKS